jgi:hypothetical protein
MMLKLLLIRLHENDIEITFGNPTLEGYQNDDRSNDNEIMTK